MTIKFSQQTPGMCIYCPVNRCIRKNVSPYVAESTYKTLIRPLLLYCYPLLLSLPQGTVSKLQYKQNRAARIINPRAKLTSWESIGKTRNTKVAIDVFKSLPDLPPVDLNSQFKRCEHEINKRGNGICVVLPPMRAEIGQKSFTYQGATFSVDPAKTRDEVSILLFRKKLNLSTSL